MGLESADAGAYQARVGQMRLLGELYNYRVVDSKCAPPPLPRLQAVRNTGICLDLSKEKPTAGNGQS